MGQPYIDWKFVETRKFEQFHYDIFYMQREDQSFVYKGFVYFKNGKDTWLDHESLDNLRNSIIQLGMQA